MKVKIKKKSQKLVSYSIVGRVEHEYTFSSLCDFQYLPIDKGVNIADEVLPKNIDPEWLTAEAPLFMPPGSFSRVETIKVCRMVLLSENLSCFDSEPSADDHPPIHSGDLSWSPEVPQRLPNDAKRSFVKLPERLPKFFF